MPRRLCAVASIGNYDDGEGGFALKRGRFSVEQIAAVLKQALLGMPATDIRRLDVSDANVLSLEEKQYAEAD